jgi:hypothetical protein
MTWLAPILTAFNWLTDPENRKWLTLGLILVLITLLIGTCGHISSLQGEIKASQEETQRVRNNWEASRDSVEMAVGENGELIGRIDGYVLTLDELNEDYKEMKAKWLFEKGKPPVVITEVVTEIRDSLIWVQVELEGDSVILVSDSSQFSPDNFRILSGRIPYEIDTTRNLLLPGKGIFELEQAIKLSTTLTRDKRSGKIEILVSTEYPGVKFSRIQGAIIQDDKENNKVLKQARKSWGVSVSAGYGVMLNLANVNRIGLAHGPYAGFGIHYSPKWAQWGK